MTKLILATVAVLALSERTPARAQFVIGPAYPYGYGYGGGYSYSYRSNFGFSVGGPRFRLNGFSGGFVTRSAYFAPPPIGFVPAGFGYNPFVPVGYGFGNPFLGGWGPGFGPPVIVVPVPVFVGGNFPDPNEAGGTGIAPARNDGLLFPRGAKDGDYLVIAPKKEVTVPAVTRVAPRPPAPVVAFDPLKGAVRAEVAEADPKKEAARLVMLGRASFVAGDYGRAAEHFERAAAADPADAPACFLHAQAKFAAGQYADAGARLREGLARDPNWPKAAFDPTEPYGDRPERFVLHLVALKKAVADNPHQAALEFVLGYELWFSGDKAEADKLFRAAEKRLPAPGPIALFKLP